ncbi:MAG: HD domain-containing protein [Tenericutes bacterium]|nr:HD domain-containing protein [Mycoplasmatota bacterium]
MNKNLKDYVVKNIFPIYEKNDKGHNIEHIDYVVRRSLEFAKQHKNLNTDIVFVVAAFHDLGHYINPKEHEMVAANLFMEDEYMMSYFDSKQRNIVYEAILDHRASSKTKPRTIYGEIVSSADRNTSIENSITRTFLYRLSNNSKDSLDVIVEDSRNHLISKFGNEGYAKEKMFFHDKEYTLFLNNLNQLLENYENFRKEYLIINNIKETDKCIEFIFDEISKHNPNMSLDEKLYYTYNKLDTIKTFNEIKEIILDIKKIDEKEYYFKDINKDLIYYIEKNIFPQYKKNDKGHGLEHILEVIRRSFALNETFKLNLNSDLLYSISAFHDLGKYIDSSTHEKIAASMFADDKFMKEYFSEEDREIIIKAIEDHRSSKEDEPRSVYGMIISSADRNTDINTVFRRSYFVGLERQPNTVISEYLTFTRERLLKKYSLDNPENIFHEDIIYNNFIKEMRELLQNETRFNELYSLVNNFVDRNLTLIESENSSNKNESNIDLKAKELTKKK